MYTYYSSVALPWSPIHLNVYETLKSIPGFVHRLTDDDDEDDILILDVSGYLLLWVRLHKLYEAGLSCKPEVALALVPPRKFTWGGYTVWVGDPPSADELDPQDVDAGSS